MCVRIRQGGLPMTTTPPSSTTEALTLVRTLHALRPQLAANGATADRDNVDPAANMELIAQAGAARLLVPVEFGGLWEGWTFGGWGDLIRAQTEIAAGDGPTGQNWGTTALVSREVFDNDVALPDE